MADHTRTRACTMPRNFCKNMLDGGAVGLGEEPLFFLVLSCVTARRHSRMISARGHEDSYQSPSRVYE